MHCLFGNGQKTLKKREKKRRKKKKKKKRKKKRKKKGRYLKMRTSLMH